MSAKKKEEAPKTALQSEEARQRVLDTSSSAGATAIGQAKAHFSGAEGERLEGLESRGSTQPIAGGEPTADFPAGETREPVGAQAEPAIYTTNGTIPVNMVASPSGLVPAATVAGDAHEAARRAQEARRYDDDLVLRKGAEDRLSRQKIESMSAADLRAVASDRGYDLGDHAGSRMTRRRFIDAQNKALGEEESDEVTGGEENRQD